MSVPKLPGDQPGTSSRPSAPADQRAREIQDALKSIVLQTASTLRSRTQLARLPASVPRSSATAAAGISEASSGLDKLAGECSRYLSLVHGLRDYLLHAQAALEIELEAATQREAEEAKAKAEAAAEALKRQQEADEAAKKKAEEDADRKRIDNVAKATETKADVSGTITAGAGTKAEDISTTAPATSALPSDAGKKNDPGNTENDAIVIDSDGDDEDDVPLAFAPKAGSVEGASKTIDLTESPALANAPKPPSSAPSNPATTLATTTSSNPSAPSIPGLDLSAFGIDMSSLTNLPDLSALGIPSLANTSSSTDTSTALAPATDFSELEKMMGMDFASSSTTNPGSNDAAAMPDLSSLSNFNLGSGSGGFGEDNDMFGSGGSGLDLSNFDFSSLTSGGDASMGAGGGVDLSSFLTNFGSTADSGAGNDAGNAGS
ncbi:hypothetical protein PSEUBRA_002981 [Kalmanozyma brasiliensis GHG001]|nr:uncharacterized protein PSEUBRA_002981 [Kalmanozyma brasiliensis GHG001]KAF6767162.1 hypothetical protein PSEUBRA_002981 [Kalmanozyma brasiliensis GHG001]